jgi:arylsulfatase A-like enzyme
VKDLNERQLADVGDPEIATRISQYEMAFKMQTSVPELMDISREPKSVLDLYGAKPGASSFANNCLLARRLVERGVRVVELYDSDWDHHSAIATRLPAKCRDVDQAMAALITDLKTHGLLDDTLVIWGAEFGRTPLRQGIDGDGKSTNPGRDHHKDAYTMWLAGGGIKGGITHGSTDDFGFSPAENPVHVHDLNATVLHLLGLNHERLTFKYQGRDFRLTDVHGNVVKGLLA